ncbi:MAG TPA: diguanylate cyclase [Rhodocyclaceae bacterium]|nr:diguanylate cyclase [Rhodocyclaceae bacterium]HMZ77299.1 diguanylate cyclase [Rhodocyclaceae bacterium]
MNALWPASLRFRLLVASLVVGSISLALLIAHSARLIEASLLGQLNRQLEQTRPLLNAALNAPLAERDYATLRQILHEARTPEMLTYLVLLDHRGEVIASEGRPASTPLPAIDPTAQFDLDRPDRVFHTEVHIDLAGQALGTLRFGLSTRFLHDERQRLIRESLELGAAVLLVALFALGWVSLWLTRRLARLTDASRQLAVGHYDVELESSGSDEVDQLSTAFLRMAATIKVRVEELVLSEALQRRYYEHARDERARLASLLSALKTGILFVGNDGIVVYYNATFGQIWRIPPEAGLVHQPALRLRPYVERLLDDTGSFMAIPLADADLAEFRLLDHRIVTQTTSPVLDETGTSVGRIWIYEDITHQRQTAELADQAERDALTGLYNRRGFDLALDRMARTARERNANLALCFIDLDGFKRINDCYGHRAGDAILVQVASEFQAQVRRRECLARVGGDEFAVLVPDVSEEEITLLAERLVKAIAGMPIRYTGQDLRLGCSVGIAIYPWHTRQPDDLMACADAAMYLAKDAGKNRWCMLPTAPPRHAGDT